MWVLRPVERFHDAMRFASRSCPETMESPSKSCVASHGRSYHERWRKRWAKMPLSGFL